MTIRDGLFTNYGKGLTKEDVDAYTDLFDEYNVECPHCHALVKRYRKKGSSAKEEFDRCDICNKFI